MAELAVQHTYRYPFESRAVSTARGLELRLATSGSQAAASPDFFRGRLTRPQRAADLLRGLVEVVQSRFHNPAALLARRLAMLDPVVTCGDDVIRFEAFSACCGVYARVDLLPPALEGDRSGRGTTNVDFNLLMQAALARVRDRDALGLAIGADAVELSRGSETVVERRVKLPVRWLRGFVEVQAVQGRMCRRLEVPGAEAIRFFRGLPRGANAGSAWVVPAGRGLRLSQTPHASGVRLAGLNRLLALDSLARHARSLRVHADPGSGATGWELVLDEAHFHLVVSPEPARGFSGEGQVLADLAGERWADLLPRVRASLRWEAAVAPAMLADRFTLDPAEVTAALAALGSRGLVGYDLALGAYFHRELPFDLALVESLHPRLQDARAIVAAGGVRIARRSGGRVEAYVAGTAVEHRVVLLGDRATCTCPWFARHEGDRGPCKHVLAAQIVGDERAADGEVG